MGTKGSQTTTSTNAPPAWANQLYQNLSQQAVTLGQQPYQPYTGQLTAPINEQQQTAIGNTNQFAGLAANAATPLTQAQIMQYYNPFQQNVIDATKAQFANTNAQQQQQVLGNAVAQGALGGNRTGVAQAALAGQQQIAEAPVIAGLEQQGYTQALGTAGNQFQQNPLNVAQAGTNIAGAQFSMGTAEQQTSQAALNAQYQQWLNAQAYPYQNLAYASGIVGGVGSLSGGTGTVTAPPPSLAAQYGGLATAGLGAYALSDRRLKEDIHKVGKTNDGQPIYRFRFKGSPQWHIGLIAQNVEKKHPEAVGEAGGYKMVDIKGATDAAVRRQVGGLVPGFAAGGVPNTPYAGGLSYVPTIPLPHGSGPPHPQNAPSYDTGMNQILQNAQKMAGAIKSGSGTNSYGGGNIFTDAYGGSASSPLEGLSAEDYGADGGRVMRYGGLVLPQHNRIEYKRGGPIRAGLGFSSFIPRRGYQYGGSPEELAAEGVPATFDERFPTQPGLAPADFNARFQGQAPPPDLDGGTIMQPGLEPPTVVSPPASAPSAPQAAPVQTAGVGQGEAPDIVTKGPEAVSWREKAIRAANAEGIDPNWFLGILKQESGMNPNVRPSRTGNVGIGQLGEAAAAEVGVDRNNPDQNLIGSARYAAKMLKHFNGDYPLATAAYNAGPGRVAYSQRTGAPLPAETQAYVPSVMAMFGQGPGEGAPRAGVGADEDGTNPPPPPRGRTGGLATGQEAPSGGGFGFGFNPDLGQALMAAGFGMAAAGARPGATFAGSVGQGGLTGLGAYGSLQRQHLAEQQLERQNARELELERRGRATEAETARYHSYEMNKPQVIAHAKDKYGVDHPIIGIPQVDKSGAIVGWKSPAGDVITNDMLQGTKPLPASATPSLPTPAEPAPAGTKAEPAMPSSPVQVASAAPIHIPTGMKVAGQDVAPEAVATKASAPKQYNENAIKDLDQDDQASVKALVKYDLLPSQSWGRTAAHAQLLRDRALQYDPTYQPAQASYINKAKYDWANGKHGDTVRQFSTAMDHIELLKGIIANLNNQNSNTWNRLANAFKEEFGGTAPTNYDAASRLVAGEIVKATVGNQNALGDRDEIAANFNRNRAPAQQLGVIDTYEGLMAGQLHNLERQYKNATKADDFATNPNMLSDRARERFYGRGQKVENAPSASAPKFDRDAAKKAGYTDKEIDDYLAGRK